MTYRSPPAPLNPLPAVVWLLAAPLIAMELVLSVAEMGILNGTGGGQGAAWRIMAFERLAFYPHLWREAWAQGALWAPEPWRLVTSALVHPSMTSALFAVVILLALGKMVAEIFRPWAVLAVFFGALIGGSLIYAAVLPWVLMPLVGAFPAVYGLIGAFTWLLWMRLAGSGNTQYRAFTMIGFLLGIQLLFGLVFGGGYSWVAEVSGFVIGFGLSFLVSPGGIARIRMRLRQR